ncbi:carbonic anhydrase 7-like [Ixodes scapularis]|uniref:carbonic anhydrase 7-like n=1 Tax=Ixodes scapularis TaxID=6945 RepID=UPI001A9FEF67|nr:carbonic anhydrase 7-like [Ixodes scapularis]
MESPTPNCDRAGQEENPNFKAIVDAVSKFQTEENVHRNIEECVVLSRLLPAKKVGRFQYFGSLTTPPCSEVVTWIVLRKPVTVSESQMDVFRRVQARGHDNGTTHHLVNNYRSPMPLNGRYVLRNFLCPPLQKGQTKMHAPARTPDSVEGQE